MLRQHSNRLLFKQAAKPSASAASKITITPPSQQHKHGTASSSSSSQQQQQQSSCHPFFDPVNGVLSSNSTKLASLAGLGFERCNDTHVKLRLCDPSKLLDGAKKRSEKRRKKKEEDEGAKEHTNDKSPSRNNSVNQMGSSHCNVFEAAQMLLVADSKKQEIGSAHNHFHHHHHHHNHAFPHIGLSTPTATAGSDSDSKDEFLRHVVYNAECDFLRRSTSGRVSTIDHSTAHLEFDEERTNVIQAALQGYSMFIGGNAGTGKSCLLRRIAHDLVTRHHLHVGVTATTGVAALNIHGHTLHSFLDVGVKPPFRFNRMQLAMYDVLIVDEVSLLNWTLWEHLLAGLRVARGRRSVKRGRLNAKELITVAPSVGAWARPVASARADNDGGHADNDDDGNEDAFSGLQVILAGDFMQLRISEEKDASFAQPPLFQHPSFKRLLQVKLESNLRQKDDPEFANDLLQLRQGVTTRRILTSATLNQPHHDPIRLMPFRMAAKERNERALMELPAPWVSFPTRYTAMGFGGLFTSTATFRVRERATTSEVREFVMAQMRGTILGEDHEAVVLFNNDALKQPKSRARRPLDGDNPTSAANESADGEEADFGPTLIAPVVAKEKKGNTFSLRLRMSDPGASDNNHVNSPEESVLRDVVTRMRGTGMIEWVKFLEQGFISKAEAGVLPTEVGEDTLYENKNLKEGCKVMLLQNLTPKLVNGSIGYITAFEPFEEAKLPDDPLYRQRFRHRLMSFIYYNNHRGAVYPIVEFTNGITAQISLHEHFIFGTRENNYINLKATVMPLVPAYAFTIHKIQGQTIQHPVEVDCNRMWHCDNLIYVAASRVTKYEHLRILNIHPRVVTADKVALRHHDALLPAIKLSSRSSEGGQDSSAAESAVSSANRGAWVDWVNIQKHKAKPTNKAARALMA